MEEKAPETAEASGKSDLDDLKRRFRAALDAKKAGRAAEDAASAGNKDGGKVHGSRGPAASRRSFRRKSG